MRSPRHVFHTRHDFKPELGWEAFQLLSETGSDGISPSNLHTIAKAVGSPLGRLSNLTKILAAMQDIGLTKKTKEGIVLSKAGRTLTKGIGHYPIGFQTSVHCLYAWKWIWDRNESIASPSWSYREVLRLILNAGATGIDSDEIVLRLLSSADERFGDVPVSFSRSSVSGVTVWLEGQALPLIRKDGKKIYCQNSSVPMVDTIRLHLAALCSLDNGEAVLDDKKVQLLAESFLLRTEGLIGALDDFFHNSDEFLFISSAPNRVIFTGSEDPFIEWIAIEASEPKPETS